LPIYTYQCDACRAELEKRQSFSDDPLTVCESCGGRLRRVLHPVGIIFKGSGFHNTDYKKPTSPTSETPSTPSDNGKASESKDGAAGAAKDGGSPETKTPAKEASKESSSTPAKAPAAPAATKTD
jgi:putative FmdB family regulatory protein